MDDAKKAARAGDATAMAKALFDAKFPDGAVRIIARDFNRTDAEDCVAEGLAEACMAIESRKKILEPGAYVLTVAKRRALQRAIEERERRDHPVGDGQYDLPAREGDDDRDERLRQGLVAARSLLPQLGPRVHDVIKYLLDAIEAGYAHVPHELIAEDLDLSVGTVRVAVFRGFEKLTRLARQRGLHEAGGVDAMIEELGLSAGEDADGDTDDNEERTP